MHRGYFGNLANLETIGNRGKTWLVSLDSFNMIWLGHIQKSTETAAAARPVIRKFLSEQKRLVRETLDKRFIYFICSREKIRFRPTRRTRPGLWRGNFTLPFIAGSAETRHDIPVSPARFPERNGRPPAAISTERDALILHYPEGPDETIPVWSVAANFTFPGGTEIHYVGYTQNPEDRFTRSRHAGLADVKQRVDARDKDIFIHFNLFRVYLVDAEEEAPVTCFLSNAMLGEVPTNEEGFIIEEMCILYFDSAWQNRNKTKEYARLRNRLKRLRTGKNVSSLHLIYNPADRGNELCFFSSAVAPAWIHECRFTLDGDRLILERDKNVCERSRPAMLQIQDSV